MAHSPPSYIVLLHKNQSDNILLVYCIYSNLLILPFGSRESFHHLPGDAYKYAFLLYFYCNYGILHKFIFMILFDCR